MEHGNWEEEKQEPSRRKRRRKEPGIIRRFFSALGTLILIGLLTSAMLVGIFWMYVQKTLAPTLEVRAEDYTMNLTSIIYCQDPDTEKWVEFQSVHGEENRILADYNELPAALWQAAVAIEDERFFQHHGVDWKRTAGAALNMFTSNDTFGGSTLTQQVLKNMTEDNAPTVNRKVREIFRALEFEKHYTKQDILELYLNTIYLGKGCYGVKTAAQYYFGKDVSQLDAAECASLIAITNNPSMYGPMYNITITRKNGTTVTPRQLNKERQELILKKMYELGYLNQSEYISAKSETLQFTDGETSAKDLAAQASGGIQINNWFVDQVIFDVSNDLSKAMGISPGAARLKIYNSGYKIYTTMNPKIQEIAESVYSDRSNLDVTSRSGQQLQSGITIVEPSTGNVVAIAGAVGKKEGNLVTSYATLQRQVGSSMKPLTVYAPAIDSGAVTLATSFDNYPVQLLNGNPWPKNSPNRYTGFTMLSEGVAKSINTIAVQTLQKLGIPNSFAFATEKLGLSLVAEDMNLSSLGLGGLTYGLNTEEMAAAYASFANDGVYNSPRTYLRVTKTDPNTGVETTVLSNDGESHVAMKETTAYFMNKLLKGVVSSGTGTSANFSGMTIAGKTGTTSDNYDRYFVGYTPYYAAAVWTGYKSNEKVSYSGNPAITMWKKVMQKIHEDLPNKDFDKPTGITTVTVCRDSGLLPTEACSADERGSRLVTVEVASGTAPTERCNLHVIRDYCTAGQGLATEFCPESTVVQRAFLNYNRTPYDGISASDDAYLISHLEYKLETEGCPVHNSLTPPEESEENGDQTPDGEDWAEPEHPGDDSTGGESSGGTGTGDSGTSGEPEPSAPSTQPSTPSEPSEPSSGDDAWWSGLWNN